MEEFSASPWLLLNGISRQARPSQAPRNSGGGENSPKSEDKVQRGRVRRVIEEPSLLYKNLKNRRKLIDLQTQ